MYIEQENSQHWKGSFHLCWYDALWNGFGFQTVCRLRNSSQQTLGTSRSSGMDQCNAGLLQSLLRDRRPKRTARNIFSTTQTTLRLQAPMYNYCKPTIILLLSFATNSHNRLWVYNWFFPPTLPPAFSLTLSIHWYFLYPSNSSHISQHQLRVEIISRVLQLANLPVSGTVALSTNHTWMETPYQCCDIIFPSAIHAHHICWKSHSFAMTLPLSNYQRETYLLQNYFQKRQAAYFQLAVFY